MRIFLIFLAAYTALALAEPDPQNAGTAGTLSVTVLDPSGAAVGNATVSLSNKVSGFKRTVQSDATGTAKVANVPPNQYHLDVTAPGFEPPVKTLAQTVPAICARRFLESRVPGRFLRVLELEVYLERLQ